MKKMYMMFLGSIGVLVLLCFDIHAQNQLELSISADKEYYLLGEPIIVYVKLKNVGNKSVEAMRYLEPDFDYVRYFITGLDGEEEQFTSIMLKEPANPRQTLPPKGSIHAAAKIFYGSDEWIFQAPGQYLLKAIYLNQVTSNSIAINVHDPSNANEQRASSLIIESQDIGLFFVLEGGDHLIDGIDRLRRIATEFPKTSLASYANYSLGINLAHDRADFKNNRLRPAATDKAVEYLEKVKTQPITLYYMVNTYLLLSDGYTKLKKTSQMTAANRDLNQLIEKSPEMARQWAKEYIEARKLR